MHLERLEAARAVFLLPLARTRQHYSGKDTQHTEESSMTPAPWTALEQRLFERLEAAMMEGNLDGEREQAAMLAAVNEERSRLGKAPVSLQDVQEAERLALGHVDYPYQFAKRGAELIQGALLAKPA